MRKYTKNKTKTTKQNTNKLTQWPHIGKTHTNTKYSNLNLNQQAQYTSKNCCSYVCTFDCVHL